MLRTNSKNFANLLYAFAVQTKGKKNYINIGKLIKKEQQTQTSRVNLLQKKMFKNKPQTKIEENSNPEFNVDQQSWIPKNSQNTEHMSTQQQQMNHKIKTAIRCETLYYECSRKKHKLQLRQYALIFCKILELRRMNPSQRKQNQDFANFLSILNKKVDEMPPEELIRIIFGIKQERASHEDMKLLLPIIEKIIKQFSNSSNNELQPKSFETLRLSTNIKLFYSLLYILEHSGSHFEKKLKMLMNETLNFILFSSMKTKKHSKTGEYFPLNLKIAFLHSCKVIDASNTCIKNLLLSILVEKEKLTLETLLVLEKTLFQNSQLLEKTRKQLFTEKDIHIKYNILFRIEKYINELIPTNLKKSSNYPLLNKELASHLSFISQLTFDQLNVMQMNTLKDQQQSKILSLFHQAYKNALIENYSSVNEKDDIVEFFNNNQLSQYSLFQLLTFFYGKLKIDNGQSLRPSVKKELKEFINLLCKFYPKLNFLTQSILIDILVISNFTNLKPILTQFLEINTYLNSSNNNQRPHFMRKDKNLMMDNFFTIFKHQNTFLEHCPSQYQLFVNSNIKVVLKQIFNSTQHINIEKYAFYLSQYCKTLNGQNLKLLINNILSIHEKNTWVNRSFKKADVDIIYKHKDYFLSTDEKSEVQLQNQTDIFGEDVSHKQQRQMILAQKLLPTLQNDQQVFKQFYKIQQKIRTKLRMALKNFKFILLLFENIKTNLSHQTYKNVVNENLNQTLLKDFKSQIECLKFQRLLTKQNCSDLTQIHYLLENIWGSTTANVQVRNQMLIHQHQSVKSRIQSPLKQDTKDQNISEVQIQQNVQKSGQISQKTLKQQQDKNDQQILDEEEQESQESEYTEQIEYLQGKDFFDLQTFKDYNLKQHKNTQYFGLKNKQILEEICKLTNNFTEMPKESMEKESQILLLKQLHKLYSDSLNHHHQNRFQIIDLASIDQNKISKQNFKEIINMEIQSRQNKQIYSLKVFQKAYPTFLHFKALQGKQINESKTNELLSKVLYVNTGKTKKNYKKKRNQVVQHQNEEPKIQVQQNKQGNRSNLHNQVI